MSESEAFGLLGCALVIAFAVSTLIGAVFLRAAVAFYNNLAGGASSPASIPVPAFGRAWSITFAISVVQMIVGLLIIGLFKADGAAAQERELTAELIYLPVGLLIMVQMLSARLPTTFGRAFLVTLCDMLLFLLVGAVLAGIPMLVFALAGRIA
jgi:hypothetical protein